MMIFSTPTLTVMLTMVVGVANPVTMMDRIPMVNLQEMQPLYNHDDDSVSDTQIFFSYLQIVVIHIRKS